MDEFMRIRREPAGPRTIAPRTAAGLLRPALAALPLLAVSPAAMPVNAPSAEHATLQLAVACPKTGELVIDDVKICYYTCPDVQTSIRIGATDICPPFH